MTLRSAQNAGAASDEPSPGEAEWAAAAAGVLRRAGRMAQDDPGAAAWMALAGRTVEGVEVPPLGTADRSAALPTAAALGSAPGEAPFLRGTHPPRGAGGGWGTRVLVADPDSTAANRALLDDLAGGATSVWCAVGEGASDPRQLADVLAGVHLDMAPVVFDASGNSEVALATARALAEVTRRSGVTLHPAGSLGLDPWGGFARTALAAHEDGDAPVAPGISAAGPAALASGDAPTAVTDSLAESVSLAADLGVGAIVVDATVAHGAGAGDAQEVGYSLAAGAAYLRGLAAAGIDVDTACRMISFRYAATDEQPTTIAKLRAARLCWHRVAQASGASAAARAQRQHAVTSPAMLTRYDSYVNMLRVTVAAFAAGAAGSEAVTILPFDSALGVPEAFSRRIARNVSALLQEEAQVAAVADPAGGAHALEMLTASIAEAAWAEFGEIEAAGGMAAALADGTLPARIARTRAERARRIATRRQPITGVSEFPNGAESPADLPQRRPGTFITGSRWAEPFEEFRDAPPASPILLVTIGSEAAAASRLQFARNLLAAGGVPIIERAADGDLAAAIADSGCAAVMFAGADVDFANDLAGAVAAAREARAEYIAVAGRPRAVLDGLPDGLVDTAVAAGDDVLAFLPTLRQTLGGTV